MAFELAAFCGLAVVLGAKHAFDADHLLAVSNLLTRRDRVAHVMSLGCAWAAGHMVTAGLVSFLVYYFADSFLAPFIARAEILVPAMLILVGLLAIAIELRRFHFHRHHHVEGAPEHSHFHIHWTKSHAHGAMAGIGFIHGLASNDELLVVLLVGLGAAAWWQVLVGVALFSVGVFAGMIVYATGIHAADRKLGLRWAAPTINVAFGVASIAYAGFLLMGGDGLNLIEALRAT